LERESFQVRALEFDLSTRAADSETIPVVVSSDAVVDVADGPEILVHAREAVDLTRAPLPIIATHNGNQINVGVVENIRLEAGFMKGDARFGERREAAEYRRDVENGTIRSVSAGYRRLKGKVRSDGVLVTTRWMPFHVAMVAEPADINAGFYRALSSIPPLELTSEEVSSPAAPAAFPGKAINMAEQQAGAGASADVQVRDNGAGESSFDPVKHEKERRDAIISIAKAANVNDDSMVRHWIQSGKSWDAIGTDILKIKEERGKVTDSAAYLGLSAKETKRFSVVRAIRAIVDQNWKGAEFEAECSMAVAQRMGKQLNGQSIMVPIDIQQRTTLQVGTGSLGGYVVGTDLDSTNFIDLLRNRTLCYQLGARRLQGLVGSLAIPKQATGGSVGWIGETGTATDNNLTLSQLTLSPKHIAGFQQFSRQTMLQSTPDIENLVMSDLAGQIGVGLDLAILAGTSTDSTQPIGIRYTSGLGTANPTSGTAVTYADAIRFQSTVADSNALFTNFAYVARPAVAAIFMGKPRFTNSDTPIWDGALLDGVMVGKPAKATLQVGTGTLLGGDFGQVIVGEWGALELAVNPYQVFQSGIVGVRAMYSVDVAVRYGAAFAIGTGITG
jgi:HK97 family phage major capsid protein